MSDSKRPLLDFIRAEHRELEARCARLEAGIESLAADLAHEDAKSKIRTRVVIDRLQSDLRAMRAEAKAIDTQIAALATEETREGD